MQGPGGTKQGRKRGPKGRMEEEGHQVIPWTGDRKVRVLWAIPGDGGEKKRKKVE